MHIQPKNISHQEIRSQQKKNEEMYLPLGINLKLNQILRRRVDCRLKFDCSYASIMLLLAFVEKDYNLYYKIRKSIFFYEKVGPNTKAQMLVSFFDNLDKSMDQAKSNRSTIPFKKSNQMLDNSFVKGVKDI